jgi:hypothetical protein
MTGPLMNTPHRFKVTPEQWDVALKLATKELGYIPNAHGETKYKGFKVAWAFDADAHELEVTLKDKPWIVPEGMIRSKVDALLKSEGIVEL